MSGLLSIRPVLVYPEFDQALIVDILDAPITFFAGPLPVFDFDEVDFFVNPDTFVFSEQQRIFPSLCHGSERDR